MIHRDEVMALRAHGSPEADDLRDKAASIAARADARIAELKTSLRAMLDIANAAGAGMSHPISVGAAYSALADIDAARAGNGESGDAGG